jgi:hypothetical protein
MAWAIGAGGKDTESARAWLQTVAGGIGTANLLHNGSFTVVAQPHEKNDHSNK